MRLQGHQGKWGGFGRRAADAACLGFSILVLATATSANAQVCGATPACTESSCARGRAFGSAAALGGTDIGPLRTADTDCQATSADNEFFDVSAQGSTVPAAPLANVVTSESRTQADSRRERFVDSRSGNAIAEVIPSAVPGGPALLEVVTSGSQATICGDVASGTSRIDALTISGTPVPIPGTVAPNTFITSPAFPLLILNEQMCQDGSHPTGGCGACVPTTPDPNDVNQCSTLSCTVNALHVQLPRGGAVLDVVIASSFAEETTCPGAPDSLTSIADFKSTYGGGASDGALLPWFIAGPESGDEAQNTLVAITHTDAGTSPGGEFIHTRLYDIHSVEACDACVPITPRDVHVDNLFTFIKNTCGPLAQAKLDVGDGVLGNQVYAGYATFQLSKADCLTPDTEKDLLPYFYQVQLRKGLASGFNGPVFNQIKASAQCVSRGKPIECFDEFNLRRNDPLYFRLLVGLGEPVGANPAANTRIIVWSDTSGSCKDTLGNVLADSRCLKGTARLGHLLVCDEEENCSDVIGPTLGNEVNIFSADNFVPAGFATGGGWFSLVAKPTERGRALHVLGYADNRAVGDNSGKRNFQAIFPAQRTRIGSCP